MAAEADDKAKEKHTVLNTNIDPNIKAAVEAFIEDYNSKNEAKYTIRSCTEAAFKGWLASRGFWPWPPEQPAAAAKPGRRKEKAGAA